jgi:hypothetical protein
VHLLFITFHHSSSIKEIFMSREISKSVLSGIAAVAPTTAPAASVAQTTPTQTAKSAALAKLTPDNAVLVYVDYVTGLDNLINTIPGKQYRNNVAAFAKFSTLFKMPTAVMGEENDYYGTFLPEIKGVIAAGGKTFAPRSTPTGYTPDFAKWLKETGRNNVIIGGISIDNCTLHTSLDLIRNGYNVYVVVDALTDLGEDFAGPHGKGMMQIIQAHWPASTVGPVDDTTLDGRGMQLPK